MKNMTMRGLLIVLLAFGLQANAQDLSRYKRVVKELASKKYQGRGYAKGGANKAGKFLAKEYKRAGVDEVTLQPFTLDIQTFAGKMEMEADGKPLQPGVDFSMREYSPGVKGEFPVYHVDTLHYNAGKMFSETRIQVLLGGLRVLVHLQAQPGFLASAKGWRMHERRPHLHLARAD